MDDVYIGKGKLAGKGVYASRDFSIGEVVKYYNLIPLTQDDFYILPEDERMFVHTFFGKMYLFPEPSRYTNHSANPNTRSDLRQMCDIAIKPIKKGDMITINATKEVQHELETCIEVYEKDKKVENFEWLKGGYRNAVIRYAIGQHTKVVHMKRIDGNWHVLQIE